MGLVKATHQTSTELTTDVTNSVQQQLWLDSVQAAMRGLNQTS